MELKREYDPADLQRFHAERSVALDEARAQAAALNLDADVAEDVAKRIAESKNIQPPKVAWLQLNHTGGAPEQNFSTDFVTEQLKNGFMELSGSVLTFFVAHDGQDVALTYQVLRAPGRYCLHCGEKLEGDETGELARLHVALKHAGAASPDTSNPAGYVWLKHFECVLNAEQHAAYKKVG